MDPLYGNHYHLQNKVDDNYRGNMTDFSSSHSVWNNFFLSAGIPSNVANDYAVTFSQHRIRIDMLKEITKEILCDMGIIAMGDIIAILRHAKNLYTQDELKKGLASATSTLKPPAPVPIVSQKATVSRPVTTDRITQKKPIASGSSSNVNFSVRTKIQSRVSLDSGALTASNKRPLRSRISESLAKRLGPAPSDDRQGPRYKPFKKKKV